MTKTTILCGDALHQLRDLPDDHFGVVVTSPPYWGLRDYGVLGQLGTELTIGEHIAAMVEVFAEVRRVLKPDGVCWLNYGDCYATAKNGRSAADTKAAGNDDRTFRDKPFSTVQGSMKAKDLCLIGARLAIALQDAGWWVRSEIVWAKSNPMPESAKDRPATSFEKVWMLTKSAQYHYDHTAVRQPSSEGTNPRMSAKAMAAEIEHRNYGGKTTDGPAADALKNSNRKLSPEDQSMIAQKASFEAALSLPVVGRNLWNCETQPADPQVWKIATKAFRGAHFATFPPELVERCLRASLRPGDPVLDPFGGAGTTAIVARLFGSPSTLIELSSEYCKIIRARLAASLVSMDGQKADPIAVEDEPLWSWADQSEKTS